MARVSIDQLTSYDRRRRPSKSPPQFSLLLLTDSTPGTTFPVYCKVKQWRWGLLGFLGSGKEKTRQKKVQNFVGGGMLETGRSGLSFSSSVSPRRVFSCCASSWCLVYNIRVKLFHWQVLVVCLCCVKALIRRLPHPWLVLWGTLHLGIKSVRGFVNEGRVLLFSCVRWMSTVVGIGELLTFTFCLVRQSYYLLCCESNCVSIVKIYIFFLITSLQCLTFFFLIFKWSAHFTTKLLLTFCSA